MRRIFLDTETTGLSPEQGHKIIEIAAIAFEEQERLPAKEKGQLQLYLNPQRHIDIEAQEVHGIKLDFLADKPLFADVVDDIVDFLKDSQLIIHNAQFDCGFLDAELKHSGYPDSIKNIVKEVVCTLKWSQRHNFQLSSHSLDYLCRHFCIDTSARSQHHSALVDVQLLSKLYFLMTRKQMEIPIASQQQRLHQSKHSVRLQNASEEELLAHENFLLRMKDKTKVEPLFNSIPKKILD